jgi:hypothetical protein
VGAVYTQDGMRRACVWRSLTSVEVLSLAQGVQGSSATSINDQGTIVGGGWPNLVPGLLWTPSGEVHPFWTLISNSQTYDIEGCWDINNNNQVVAEGQYHPGSTYWGSSFLLNPVGRWVP